ncbi:MAG: hypothetical protein COU22_01615 [Candidatus Komeilibacteria bacterium CG10_big_fil_rev_8_21_14_0_10_41_13]|uniref:Uncharacterized protein n=1 Tax=Candidatus Komeilibacteria bacterium CG10_big_fil_rev_8_21_14_0_10_41_13 TaxID=1974476 RepID=A0A2M6WCP3_9BACT|nr:MAG: hypothetical protein COU22_01615 [Candidatus Komeilibacteria bacterium CG10_big_fil_rev_8_21_14_0_10_41_13]
MGSRFYIDENGRSRRKVKVNINFTPDKIHDFTKATIRMMKSGFRGMGRHELANHGPHGLHIQLSIGKGSITFNFRLLYHNQR